MILGLGGKGRRSQGGKGLRGQRGERVSTRKVGKDLREKKEEDLGGEKALRGKGGQRS